jgi:arylsulfatase A-like enzyme
MTAKPQITRMGWRYLLDFLIHPPLDFPYFAKSSVRVGWSEPEIVQLDSKRPNVILISLDTLRADALGCYGNDGDGSPIIDAFAKENVRFENAFSQCSWTLPSHLSMFTSLFPPELASELDGFWFNTLQTKYGGKARSIHPTTLADILKKEGYYCAAFTGGGFVSAFYGFYKGFHIYNESNEASRISFLPAQAWIGKNAEKNFFVFVHTFAIHSTLIKPEWLKRFGSDSETLKKFLLDDTPKGHRNSYEYRVSVVDHYLGEFLSFLKDANLYEDTMIILTSDHGESFGEVHNDGKYVARGHGAVAYDEQIRVPLVIKLPGRLSKGPMVIEEDVRLLDVAPTILAALGLDPVLEFRGKSILPDFPSPENQMYSGVFSKAGGKTLSQSLRENGKKYILHHATGEEEFYDLTSDPGEERNLASQQTPEMLQLKKKYLELSERLGKREINLKKSATAAPPDIQEALKALGYLE